MKHEDSCAAGSCACSRSLQPLQASGCTNASAGTLESTETALPSEAAKTGKADSRLRIRRIVSAGLILLTAGPALLAQHLLPDFTGRQQLVFVLFLASYSLAAWPVLRSAARNIRHGQVFDEMFLMSVASLGAFAIGAMEEAIGVMVFYRLGEYLMELAGTKSSRSVRALLDLQPDTARLFEAGQTRMVRAAQLKPGDLVQLRAGERVPADGKVEDGTSLIDTRHMTGEAQAREATAGSTLLSGFIVLDGRLLLRCERPASESSASRILGLVETAARAKAKTELFITKFARVYTPAVVGAAAALALVPPMALALLGRDPAWVSWLYRALVMLVISCPCALVLSIPLGYLAGMGGAARRGILVKGGRVFDTLAEARTIVFDKTGTLSDGIFKVQKTWSAPGHTEEELLKLGELALAHTNHPLAQTVRTYIRDRLSATGGSMLPAALGTEAAGRLDPTTTDGEYREIAGQGVLARLGQGTILAGSRRLLANAGIAVPLIEAETSMVFIARDQELVGFFQAGDSLKPGAAEALERLGNMGIRRTALLTGDSAQAARVVAEACQIPEVHAGLLPQDKLERLETIMRTGSAANKGKVLFVGDGTNDAPVLARADAGLAMGADASAAALEAADVVLLSGRPDRVPEALYRARRTRSIIIQNIALALGIKLAFLAFGGLGLASMWEAVIADVGVALLAVLNSSRALR